MKLFLLCFLFSTCCSEGIFKFRETLSEVLRDDDGRARGIFNRQNKTFLLGGLFPIHTPSPVQGSPCGALLPLGVEMMEAMLYAIDRINTDPELLPGVELGYDIRDTCLSETVGLDEAIDLIMRGRDSGGCEVLNSTDGTERVLVPTQGIVGAAASRVSVPVASLGRLFHMPQVSYASTSPLLNDRTRYSYFRRTVPSDDMLAIVDILRRFGWNYVSILYTEDTYGSSGVNAFLNVSGMNNICIDFRQGMPPTFSYSDYDKVVADLGKSKANVIVFFALLDTVREVFMRINKDESLSRRFTWITSDGWARDISVVHSIFNETATGLIGIVPYKEHMEDFEQYISKLTINSNKRNIWFPEFFASFANCSVRKDCDKNTNVTTFPNYQQGSLVPFIVDAVYSFAHALHDFLVDNCNETDTASFQWMAGTRTCLGQSRELNGPSLMEYLSKVNFTSITKHSISFDKAGGVHGLYEIVNYQAMFSESGDLRGYQYVTVGTWRNGKINIRTDVDLQYGLNTDGSQRNKPVKSQCGGCLPGTYIRDIPESCCDICEPCLGSTYSSKPLANKCSNCLIPGEREMWGNNPFTGSNSCVLIPETSARYSDPWAILSLFLACCGLVCVVVTTVVFGIYWKTPIVKSSGREQMILLLTGISFSFILPFVYVAPPSIPICLLNRLGIWFCYSLMFGALVIKVQRVARLFYGVKKNIHYTPRFATPIYQVLFTLTIVLIQMIPLVVSLVFTHPDVLRNLRYDQESKGRFGLPEVVIVCRKEETGILVLSLLYETCIISVATILGVFSFKFPKNFNEAKYISFCTFSLLVVWLGLIPAYFTTGSRPEIQNAVISLFIILSAFGVLCFIFGPKMFIVLFRAEENQRTRSHFSTNATQKKETSVKSELG